MINIEALEKLKDDIIDKLNEFNQACPSNYISDTIIKSIKQDLNYLMDIAESEIQNELKWEEIDRQIDDIKEREV